MTIPLYSRDINFEAIINCRDLGGYQTCDGNTVAWRRLFRSGDLRHMTSNDSHRLKDEIGLVSVLDLRSSFEIKQEDIGLVQETGFKYYNVSLITDGDDRKASRRRYSDFTSMGEFYLYLIHQDEVGPLIIQAFDFISRPENHPLLFHCSMGKDRTGIIAAMLLSVLGVANDDIISDYILSAPYMNLFVNDMNKRLKPREDSSGLPDYFWEAVPESMSLFLSSIEKDFGSAKGYLETNGAEPSLFERLEKALLM